MASPIPAASRTAVKERARGRCERCGGPGAQWHHRRRRAVLGEHRHGACNGVWLCPTCHNYVHAHPVEARLDGFILPAETSDPSVLPVKTVWGWKRLTCDGEYVEA